MDVKLSSTVQLNNELFRDRRVTRDKRFGFYLYTPQADCSRQLANLKCFWKAGEMDVCRHRFYPHRRYWTPRNRK